MTNLFLGILTLKFMTIKQIKDRIMELPVYRWYLRLWIRCMLVGMGASG